MSTSKNPSTKTVVTEDQYIASQRTTTIQDVVLQMPQFTPRLEQALRDQLPDVISANSGDPLYNPTFDPIAYINEHFPNEDSLTNEAVHAFLDKTRAQISNISSQLRQELRAQAVNTSTAMSSKAKDQPSQTPSTDGSDISGDDDASTTSTHAPTPQQVLQDNVMGKDLHEVIVDTNQQVASLFEHIKTIKRTAAPSEQLVAQICVDISALDLAKQHLQRTTVGLRNLHMLISTTSHLADAVHQRNFAQCVTLIDDVDNLASFFRPYKKIEKIRIVLSQIQQLKKKICDDASTLIRRTVILNVPAHTIESFPPNSEKAIEYRDALQVIKLVNFKEEREIRDLWCDEILSKYNITFTKNEEVIGLQHIDRRLSWFRREFKRCLPIYDHIFPYGYNIWHHLLSQFCLITKQHVQGYLNVFTRVSFADIINTSGVGYTTYYYEYNNSTNNHPKLLKIQQGRKRGTIPTTNANNNNNPIGLPSDVPITPAHCIDDASIQKTQLAGQTAKLGSAYSEDKKGFFGSLTAWADAYANDGLSPSNQQSPQNVKQQQDDGGLTLSLDDFDDENALQKAVNNAPANNHHNSIKDSSSNPHQIVGKVHISNEKNIPQLVNAVSKTMLFERELADKLAILDQEHTAQRQFQRFHQPFLDAFKTTASTDNGKTRQNDSDDDEYDEQQQSYLNNKLPLTEISSIFEPFMYNLIIVERSQLLSLINQAISHESWVPSEIHSRPRYPSCDQLLFYIKRSIDNISRVCTDKILTLLFAEYITALRHYLNVLTIKSDPHYLRYANYTYLATCSPNLVVNPSGYTLSGVTTNIMANRGDVGAVSVMNSPIPAPVGSNGATSGTSSSGSSSRAQSILSWTGGYMGGIGLGNSNVNGPSKQNDLYQQQMQNVQNPGTVQTIEQLILLAVCFNTAEHVLDILPSFLLKLQEKLNNGVLPPIQPNEVEIVDYAEIVLGYIKQNIWLFSAHRIYQEISMLPRMSWSNNQASLPTSGRDALAPLLNAKDKAKQQSNIPKRSDMLIENHTSSAGGDVNVYALSTTKFIKFFAAYASILFSPAYYSAFIKYISQRLFPDLLNAMFTCRAISNQHAQQMSVDVYTIVNTIKAVYNFQLDTHTYNNQLQASSGRAKPGVADSQIKSGQVDDASLMSSTSLISPQLLSTGAVDPNDPHSNSVVYKYPIVEIPAQQNTATVRIFMRWITKEIALLESYTKVISGSTPHNIINTISIYLGNDCTDDIVLSLFNVIGIHLTESRQVLQAYRDLGVKQKEQEQAELLAKQQKEEEEAARRQKKLSDAAGISKAASPRK